MGNKNNKERKAAKAEGRSRKKSQQKAFQARSASVSCSSHYSVSEITYDTTAPKLQLFKITDSLLPEVHYDKDGKGKYDPVIKVSSFFYYESSLDSVIFYNSREEKH